MVSNWVSAQFGGRCPLWSCDCSCPLPSRSMPASLPPGGGVRWGLYTALLWHSLNPLFCERTRGHHAALEPLEGGEVFLVSQVIPWFGLLAHVSSLRLSSGLVLTLRPRDAARTSLPHPHLLVTAASPGLLLSWQLQ